MGWQWGFFYLHFTQLADGAAVHFAHVSHSAPILMILCFLFSKFNFCRFAHRTLSTTTRNWNGSNEMKAIRETQQKLQSERNEMETKQSDSFS